MQSDETRESLSEEDLAEAFGPVLDIQDEMAGRGGALPIAQPLPEVSSLDLALARQEARSVSRSLRLFGLVVTVLLGIQTAEIVYRVTAPSRRGALLERVPDPDRYVSTTLRESRERLGNGLYQEVVAALEPLVAQPEALAPEQRFEINLLLAKAYRELGDIEMATRYTLGAMDETGDGDGMAQRISRGQMLLEEQRWDDARGLYCEVLALRDALSPKEAPLAATAAIRLADAYLRQARTAGALARLPQPPGATEGKP